MFAWKAEKEGRASARLWYWKQALHAVPFSLYWGAVMLNSYIKIAWRNIKRHKAYSMINIIGMALGMACCILIFLWIQDEMSWDRFHGNGQNIYLVTQKQYDGHLTPVTPVPLASHLKNEYPEVRNATRFMSYYKLQLKSGDSIFAEEPVLVDPSFFQIFTYDFIQGHPETALSVSNSMVITEELAAKLFDRENPLGKTITVCP